LAELSPSLPMGTNRTFLITGRIPSNATGLILSKRWPFGRALQAARYFSRWRTTHCVIDEAKKSTDRC
jgi:hypothetical protein